MQLMGKTRRNNLSQLEKKKKKAVRIFYSEIIYFENHENNL